MQVLNAAVNRERSLRTLIQNDFSILAMVLRAAYRRRVDESESNGIIHALHIEAVS